MNLEHINKTSKSLQTLKQLSVCVYIILQLICLPLLSGATTYCLYRYVDKQNTFNLTIMILSIAALCISLCNIWINTLAFCISIITVPTEFNLEINFDKYIVKLPTNGKFKELSSSSGKHGSEL